MTDLGALRKTAEDQGWRVERTAGNHLRWVPPDPAQTPVISGITDSDWRATRNTLARLRRAGLRTNDNGSRKDEDPMKERERPAVAAVEEQLFPCLDCGTDHPRSEMAINPDGRPTRYCKMHMNQRRSRGRLAQIARDRERAQGNDALSEALEALGRADLHVVGEDAPDDEAQEDSGLGGGLREAVRGEVEVLITALSELETRVNERLGSLEMGLQQVRDEPAPVTVPVPVALPAAPSVPPSGLAAQIETFARHTLWLAAFPDGDLSPEEKRTLVEKAARRFAAALREEAP